MRLWPRSTGDEIRETFAFLTQERGYRLIADSDAGMGGSLAYRSPELWITVEWDRSDRWLEFSPTRSAVKVDWDLVDHLLRGAPHYEGAGVPMRTAPVPELAAFVRAHLIEIEARFRGPARAATVSTLLALRKEQLARVQAWWDGLERAPGVPDAHHPGVT
jgi:hypothetical protein